MMFLLDGLSNKAEQATPNGAPVFLTLAQKYPCEGQDAIWNGRGLLFVSL